MTRPLPTVRTLLTTFLAAVLLLLAPGPARAQSTTNDPDQDLFDFFLGDPRDAESISSTPVMDMEVDDHGRLLVAYGVIDGADGTARVEVVVRTPGVGWSKLASMTIDAPGGYGPGTIVKSVSVAVVSAAEGIDDNNFGFVTAVFEQKGSDWLVYQSGSLKTAWKPLAPRDLVLTGVPKKAVTDPTFIAPSIAVIPTDPGSFKKYVVAIACAMPGTVPGDSAIKLVWMDFFTPGYFGPELYVVAGRGSKVLTGNFGRPSLAVDAQNGKWGVAFDNLTEPRVQVISGDAGDQPSSMAKIFETGPDDHHPTLRGSKGEVNLLTLGRPKDGAAPPAWELKAYEGYLYQPNSFLALGQVDDQCRTPADVDIRGSDVFAAASCFDDSGRNYRISVFEFKRTVLLNLVTRMEDVPSFATRQPRMAVAPVGPTPYFAVGFANSRSFPVPGGVGGAAAVMLDP